MKNFENYDILRVFHKEAFEKNLIKTLEKFKTKLSVVVKSDAYGIGIENVLPIFEQYKITDFFCQDIIEAIDVKKHLSNKNANIYTFAGVQSGQEETFVKNNIIPVCVSLKQIQNFNEFAKTLKTKPKIGIHFDTGMNRTGLSMEEVDLLSDDFEGITSNLDVVIYISHLHSSYEKDSDKNKKQLCNFIKMTSKLPDRPKSLSATGGSFVLSSEYHFDLLRVGYGLYGILKGMNPVISVYAKILQIREVKKNQTIGYFAGYKAKKDIKVAILNMGYKDGYSRSLSHTNKWKDLIRKFFKSGAGFATSYVTIENYKCPVVGIISMNNTIVDVSNVPVDILNRHNFVEVIGNNSNIMDFREANGFVPCDLLTSLLKVNPNALDLTEQEFHEIKKGCNI